MSSLVELGYGSFFAVQLERLADGPHLVPARVTADSGDIVELAGGRAALGRLSGRLRHVAEPAERPTTGDWLAVDDRTDPAVIHHVLQRRTALRRRAAGSDSRPQVVAANADVFFVVTAADRDLNPRRIERYLTAVWDGGAQPVVVVNKIDLVDDATPQLQQIETVALAVPVLAVSAQQETGLAALQSYLETGITVGFIGSSGVGKSSLINRILGRDVHPTRELRADGKGRHTTTRRELLVLPSGGIVIDTPGMREFGMLVEDASLESAFAEIAHWAEQCHFRDCQHEGEPECAVRAAVAAGELRPERVESFLKLRRELAAAQARRDPVLGANAKRRWKAIHKQKRVHSKAERKRRP